MLRGVFSRLSRYVLREVWPLYLGGALLFYFLQMTDIISGAAGSFLSYHTGLVKALRLLSYMLPRILNVCLVVAVPFALLLAYGRLGKDSEIKALYAGGVRPLSLLTPLFLPSLLLGAVAFVNASYLAPAGFHRYWDSFYTQVFQQPVPPPTTSSYAYRQGDSLYTAGQVVGQGQQAILTGVVVRAPQGTYSAPVGTWDMAGKRWILPSSTLVDNAGKVTVITRSLALPQSDTFSAPPRPPAQSTSPELRAQVTRWGLGSEEGRRAAFELSRRLADALTPLVFALAAGALGLSLSSRAWAIGAVILFLVAFYALYSTAPQLAAVGALSPLVAAWLPNAAFGLLGLALAWRLR